MTEKEKTDEELSPIDRITRGFQAGVPCFYFNGFATAASTGDIASILEQNGKPVAVLNMSYTVAKTLSVSLGNIIAAIEEQSGRQIMTTQEIEKFSYDSEEKKTEKSRPKRKTKA